ncbi:MAG TPA: hypothetical protein VFD74_07695 [Thermoleophilia bacterium]|nr:hypothetical protein [Thermoleophilia bacterium]
MATDRDKIAMLVRHWVEHNEGHRGSYLEWRDKLSDQDLPVTLAALQEVADLTDRANEALRRAAAELAGGEVTAAPEQAAHTHEHTHPHTHEHTHEHEHSHEH